MLVILLAVYLPFASIPGSRIESCFTCGNGTPRKAGPLRLLDLNMLHGFPDFQDLPLRTDLIVQGIRSLDADVVMLQEAPWTTGTGLVARSMALSLGYNYVYFRAEGNKNLIFFEEGQAILSRFPLKDPRTTILPPRVDLFEQRIALAVTAVTPFGDVTLIDTHLTDKDPQKNLGQASSLLSFVSSLPQGTKIVSGDLNATPDTPQVQMLSAAWTDTWSTLHPGDLGLTNSVDDLHAASDPLEKRIDYVFLVPESAFQLVSVEKAFDHPYPVGSGWQAVSDHIGLLVEVEPE